MQFVLRKTGRALLSVWLLVTAIFLLMRLAGDPALEILGPDEFPPEVIERFRVQLGLDRPLVAQYTDYLAGAVRGDFGRSFLENRSALDVVAERLSKTLQLMLASLAISLLLGVPAGIIAALRRNELVDTGVTSLALVFQAMPNFVLGVLLILVFAVWLRLLPAGGSEELRHLVLPALTFGASGAAVFARFMRSAVLDVVRQPYIQAVRARGIGGRHLLFGHILPNAALPLLTILGFSIGGLFAGSIIVETVFAWPGIGRLTATAVGQRDLPVVQVIALLVMATMVTTNLLVDLAYAWLDPRIRLGHRR